MNTDNPVLVYRAELRAAASRRAVARRRRLVTLLAVGAVGAITASLSFAAARSGWLTGEPAPPEAISGFKQYTPQLGFHPQVHKAQFVAEDGDVKLYVTPNREGGICYLVDEPWKPADAGDGGTCASKEKADQPITAGLLGISAASRDGLATIVIAGRVDSAAARAIRFEDPAGTVVEREVGAGGFYVAAMRMNPLDILPVATPNGIRRPSAKWEPTFVALDADGQSILQSKILLVQRQGYAAGGEVTPHGPYPKRH
jgi:hypothetical protein